MLSNKFKIVIAVFCTVFMICSCEKPFNHEGRTPVVSVGGQYLYKEDISRLFVAGHSDIDSVALLSDYVRNWIEEALFYRMAVKNVAKTAEIERLVENYRKALFVNIYQERLIEQRLQREITDEEVNVFYEQNKDMFILDEPMMKGLFMKVAKGAPQLSSVRKWYRKLDETDLENLEKYSLTNAIAYEYFNDSWRSLASVAAKMPITESDLLARLKYDDVLEFSDSTSVYFINATALLKKGEFKPVDLATVEITQLLSNSMKANFIKEVKRNMYESALTSGDVKFYDDKSSVGLRNILQPAKK